MAQSNAFKFANNILTNGGYDATDLVGAGINTPLFLARGSNGGFTVDVETKVQFDTEIYDTGNCYDNSTNYRFTPTTAGYYVLGTNVRIFIISGFTNLTYTQGRILRNDTDEIACSGIQFGSAGYYFDNATSGVYYFNGTTDYATVVTTTGRTSGTIACDGSHSYFYGYKLIGS